MISPTADAESVVTVLLSLADGLALRMLADPEHDWGPTLDAAHARGARACWAEPRVRLPFRAPEPGRAVGPGGCASSSGCARRGPESVRGVEPPSARPWLGVGAALSALPAAGGCFCAALVLAVVADSDPGAVYEQHRWLGAIVAASAVCAYVAMMGWATLRHGGLPAPVLLIALVLAGAPFLLPGRLFLPAAALAVAGCAALATVGLAHPPATRPT